MQTNILYSSYLCLNKNHEASTYKLRDIVQKLANVSENDVHNHNTNQILNHQFILDMILTGTRKRQKWHQTLAPLGMRGPTCIRQRTRRRNDIRHRTDGHRLQLSRIPSSMKYSRLQMQR